MNYLQLCQRLRQEAGVSGSGPATTVSQTGMLGRIVDWVKQSWIDIQKDRSDWLFMRKEFTFNTVANTRDYPPVDYAITDLDKFDTKSFLIYETALGASDEGPLQYLPYGKWRERYRAGYAARDANRPNLFTIMPNGDVRFEPKPDKVYTISGDYKRTVQTFADNADEPTGLPAEYHMIIVWHALHTYAFFEDAPDKLDEAETKHDDMMHNLLRDQLPEMDANFESLV